MSSAVITRTSNKAEAIRAAHGGKVYEAARRWHIDPEQVMDFSANINPLGPPDGVQAAIENGIRLLNLRAYPDANAFVSAVADKSRLVPDQIIVGSGTASLMFAVLRTILPKRVLVLEPAFGEYSRACAAVKAEVTRWPLMEAEAFAPDFANLIRTLKKNQVNLVILNSPHNPTGALYPREELLSLISVAGNNNVAVMLDEAFIDYAPHASLVSWATMKPRTIVLRSLTKFYAMPGLRVGYAVCEAKLAAKVKEQIDPWSVSTVALEAGRAALEEDKFAAESSLANAQARKRFAEALRAIGLKVFPSAANFLLAKLPCGSGAGLATWLESERILIRRCDSFRGLGDKYVRLAVRPGRDNLRLISLIDEWLKQNE